MLDSDEYLELAGLVGSSVLNLAAYVASDATGPSAQVYVESTPGLETAVAAGSAVRVQGCVNAENGRAQPVHEREV